MYQSALLLLLLALLCASTLASPGGAPADACETMTPGHGVEPQESEAPYNITLEETDDGVRVSIIPTDPDEGYFKGFMVQARDLGDATPQGSFSSKDPNVQTVECSAPDDTVTHVLNDVKTRVTFMWAPPEPQKTVDFTLTIVKEKEVFWVKQTTRFNSAAGVQASVLFLTATLAALLWAR